MRKNLITLIGFFLCTVAVMLSAVPAGVQAQKEKVGWSGLQRALGQFDEGF